MGLAAQRSASAGRERDFTASNPDMRPKEPEPTPPVRRYQPDSTKGKLSMRYLLLWLIGVPIPVLILIWLLFR